MTYEIDVMREITSELHVAKIVSMHGRVGGQRLREVLEAAKIVFQERPAELFTEGLCVIATLDPTERYNPGEGAVIARYQIAATLGSAATVQVLPNRSMIACDGLPANPSELSARAVVYRLTPGQECFVLPESFETIHNPNGYPSAIGAPTFFLLEEALKYYGDQLARRTTCKLLSDCWHDGETRLLLANKPESIMRGSLAQHLRTVLREHAEVFEESIVSETEPVDIKVTFTSARHRALIEIKWLGRSVNADGNGLGTPYHAPSRVIEGAEQLADYRRFGSERGVR